MGLGDVADRVIPKPVLVDAGDDENSITSRYFTPHRCHTSHAATGAIGVATACALPGTVAGSVDGAPGHSAGDHDITVLHPQGRIDVQVRLDGAGRDLAVTQASLVRTARKILQGELHLPGYVFSTAATPTPASPARPTTIIVPTAAGGANDAIARTIARGLGPRLGRTLTVDNRSGAHGSIAAEYVARARPDGHTLLLGYIATHALNPALQRLGYDPVADFAPIGLIGSSSTVLVAPPTGRGRQLKSSSRTSRPIRTATATRPQATAPRRTSRPSCSRWRRARSCARSPTTAPHPHSAPLWVGRRT